MKKIVFTILISANLFAASVAEYQMNESVWNGTAGEVKDSIGSNDGTAQNGTAVTTGINGNGGLFDGTDDYIELANELSVLRGTGSLSVWIKTTQTGDDTMWRAPGITGIEEAGGGDDVFWGWIDASGHIGMTYANESATKSTTAINDNEWHHAVFTRDSATGEVVVYIDGVEEARETRASGTVSTNRTFTSIGRIEDTGGTPEYFKGSMDEVEIFDTVLTPDEVKALYFKYHHIAAPSVEYHMDECYWMNSSSATEDVKDSSSNAYHATSSNSATITNNTDNPPVCNYGTFSVKPDLVSTEDTTAGNTAGGFTVSFWIKADQDFEQWAVMVSKSKSYYWNDGWGFVNPDGEGTTLRFYINKYTGTYIDTTIQSSDGWVHVVGTYDKQTLRLYKDGVEIGTDNDTADVDNSGDPIRMGWDNDSDGEFIGSLDEVKFWDSALSATEIKQLYINEKNGLNYDGTARTCPTCTTSVAAHSWELIGIPADLRQGNYTVNDLLGDDMTGSYGTDWRIYRRDYSDTNNSSWTTYIAADDVMEFGKGYWLGSKNASSWDVNDIVTVDYNATTSGCQAAKCVEIEVKSVSLDSETDDLNGTGPYRYNLAGFIGKTAVEWADCRFVISDSDGSNQEVLSPTDANLSGYAGRMIWQYSPNGGNDYSTCDDTMECKLLPYKGFWIELHGKTKNKTVKLLIPKE
jgi:hypothetical protein